MECRGIMHRKKRQAANSLQPSDRSKQPFLNIANQKSEIKNQSSVFAFRNAFVALRLSGLLFISYLFFPN
jgi:hypothetical protein